MMFQAAHQPLTFSLLRITNLHAHLNAVHVNFKKDSLIVFAHLLYILETRKARIRKLLRW